MLSREGDRAVQGELLAWGTNERSGDYTVGGTVQRGSATASRVTWLARMAKASRGQQRPSSQRDFNFVERSIWSASAMRVSR